MAGLRSVLPLLFVAALIAFEERISVPSCETVDGGGGDTKSPNDLKVVMVADLLLLGPDAGFTTLYFRDPFTSKFLKKSFESLKPDMLVVLGDITTRGSELTNSKWLSLLQQFQRMLGPFMEIPLHIGLGDRDIGQCDGLNGKTVSQISSNLPGLDSAGCSSFEISNISFVSLNAVALLCENNDLRFSVEKFIEKESLEVRTQSDKTGPDKSHGVSTHFTDSELRENDSSSSGPVLLLHFPLHRTTTSNCGRINALKRKNPHESSRRLDERFVGLGPHEVMHSLPANATEYILQALKPRIVFSAHTHQFCDYTHRDGTREVTIPSMTWAARGDPGFIVVTFGQNKVVTVSRCLLARESLVLYVYGSLLILVIATTLLMSKSCLMDLDYEPRH